MRRGYSFRPRGWTLALAAAACVAFIALGNWQSRRADAKRALAHELDAAARAAPPGLAPGPPAAGTPGGLQAIDGVALERLPRALETGASSSGAIRQNLDIAAFAAETGLRLEPLVIEQHSDTGDGLVRDWPRADLGIEK